VRVPPEAAPVVRGGGRARLLAALPPEIRAFIERHGLSPKRGRALLEKNVDIAELQRLIDRGAPKEDASLLAANEGNTAVRIAHALLDRGYSAQDGLATVADAYRCGLADALLTLAESPLLLNPEVLVRLIREGSRSHPGYLQAVRDAAARVADGHRVALERGADVLDLDAREAIQHKEVTSRRADEVGKDLQNAAEQLRGERGEAPPRGFWRILDIRITSEANPLYDAGHAELLDLLNRTNRLHGVDRVKVTNGRGTFEFESPQRNGQFRPYAGPTPPRVPPVVGTEREREE
jgi:hypothetical protein